MDTPDNYQTTYDSQTKIVGVFSLYMSSPHLRLYDRFEPFRQTHNNVSNEVVVCGLLLIIYTCVQIYSVFKLLSHYTTQHYAIFKVSE